jgi:hypothetical protein
MKTFKILGTTFLLPFKKNLGGFYQNFGQGLFYLRQMRRRREKNSMMLGIFYQKRWGKYQS